MNNRDYWDQGHSEWPNMTRDCNAYKRNVTIMVQKALAISVTTVLWAIKCCSGVYKS